MKILLKNLLLLNLIIVAMLVSNCKKTDDSTEDLKGEIPYNGEFVKSPDYSFLPYFKLTNISKSRLENITVTYDNYIIQSKYTISLNPGQTYKLGESQGIIWLWGEKAIVSLEGNKWITTYECGSK